MFDQTRLYSFGSFRLNIRLSNLDLSAEFDVVNVRLLLKRLRIIGFPDDLVGLIKDTAIYPATMA